MAIFGGIPNNFGGFQQVGSFGFQSGGIQAQSNAFAQQSLGLGGPAAIIQVLQQLISSLAQLSQGWGGLLGQQAGAGSNFGGAGTNFTSAGSGYSIPNFLPPGAVAPTISTGSSLYGGGSSTSSAPPPMPFPVDGGDYASYLQAQIAGGALEGRTTVNQNDGIPGTRFYSVQPSQLWQANVGRQYAYQFAAEANGFDPLSPQGLAAGAQATQQMNPQAQLFMQVASVFKGNLDGGPGNYDNAGLKQLLINHGAGDLTNKAGVGQSDVQTIGAVTAAINRGQLTLDDVINSGTIDNLSRYGEIINYVQSGAFQSDLNGYDSYPI